MRRALAVAAELVEQLLGRTIGRAAVTGRHDAAEAVASLGVGHDRAPQVEGALGLVEVGVVAERIGVPDFDQCSGDRLALRVGHLAVHEQDLALVGVVVQPGLALADRRSGDVERPFDGARRAARLDADLALLLVEPDIEIMIDTETG